jgi:A/G-specific adenine glycosylase
MKIHTFVEKLVNFYHQHSRDLPWRKNITPYSIFVSEIMLQQTQVARVLTKYPEFVHRFPDFISLVSAPLTDVLRLWQGMGYNRRAKYLHDCAKEIMRQYKGDLPDTIEKLESLPGIGPATAGSIACFAFNAPTVFIETNIRRSILFHFFAEDTEVSDLQVRKVVEKCMKHIQKSRDISPREWYWALMDYGSYLKTVVDNPNKRSKHYVKQSKFAGSDRQIRGALLREYLQSGDVKLVSERETRIWKDLIMEGLITEGIQSRSELNS